MSKDLISSYSERPASIAPVESGRARFHAPPQGDHLEQFTHFLGLQQCLHAGCRVQVCPRSRLEFTQQVQQPGVQQEISLTGVPQEVEPRLAAGVDVLLDIDVQGARQVRSRIPEAVKVFVFPPSREVLETRLRARATDSPESVARRLAAARRELAEFGEYDYAIINEDLEAAADELRAVLVARRASRDRRRERLEAILKTFSP